MSNWRQTVAHVASPWEWRTRGRVVALVVLSVVGSGAGLGWMLSGSRGVSLLLNLPIFGALAYLMWVVPARRALRRWDEAHRRSPAVHA
jgi:hypothetical protein